MNWNQQWIDDVLENIPAGGYRRRLEAELRDHLEDQCRALTASGMTEAEARAEAMRAMGEPARLQREYLAAWRRSLPGRLAELGHRLRAWALGLVVMIGVHVVVSYVISQAWWMAISLPRNSPDPQVRMIREAAEWVHNSYLPYLIPLVFALIAGACYLGFEFRTSRRPAWQIIVGLSLHWAFVATLKVWVEALDDHRTFWEEFAVYMTYNIGYYSFTLSLCVLLGVVFDYILLERRKRPSAA